MGVAGILDVITLATQKALAQLPPSSAFHGLTFPRAEKEEAADPTRPSPWPFSRVLAGIAGFDRSPAAQQAVEEALSVLYRIPRSSNSSSALRVTNDVDLVTFAARRHPGIESLAVLIAGTGSVAMSYRVVATAAFPLRTGRSGGWGYVLGDEGSGFDIGRRGVRAVLGALERARLRAESSELPVTSVLSSFQLAVLRALGVPGESSVAFDLLSEVLRSALQGSSALKFRIAALALVVLDAAAAGHAEACEIVASAADGLVSTLMPLVYQGDLDPKTSALVLTGGLMRSKNYRDILLRKLETKDIRFSAVDVVADVAREGVQSLVP